MHVIFPAQNAAMELQAAIHAYMADKKNEWFAYQIDDKVHETRQSQLRAHVVQLSGAVERLRARVHNAVRLLHFQTQTLQTDTNVKVVNPEVDSTRYAALCRLWDSLAEFKPVQLTDIPNNVPVEQLENYVATMVAALKTAIQQFGLRDPLKQLGLRSFECPNNAGFDVHKSFRIVRAILTDAVEQQMAWAQRGDNEFSNLEQALTQECHFNFKNPIPQMHRRHRDFMRCVIAPLQSAIETWVQKAIPEQTWSVWTIRDLSLDLVLEQGKDFRILDWEKRMASGQWEMTDVTSLVGTPGVSEKDETLTDVVEEQVQAHYQSLDPYFRSRMLQLVSSIPQHVIPGNGVSYKKSDVNIVVDPVARYSFFLRAPQLTLNPLERVEVDTAESTRQLKDLIGTEAPSRQPYWPAVKTLHEVPSPHLDLVNRLMWDMSRTKIQD